MTHIETSLSKQNINDVMNTLPVNSLENNCSSTCVPMSLQLLTQCIPEVLMLMVIGLNLGLISYRFCAQNYFLLFLILSSVFNFFSTLLEGNVVSVVLPHSYGSMMSCNLEPTARSSVGGQGGVKMYGGHHCLMLVGIAL